MDINSWIIISDERRVGGMLEATRALAATVTAVVVGARSLADTVAGWGFDRVLCLETAADLPAEAYCDKLATLAAREKPRLVLASDMPVSRILLGAVAASLNAAVLGAVRSVAAENNILIASRLTAEGKVLEDLEISNVLAGIYDGEDAEITPASTVTVELFAAPDVTAMRLLETVESAEGAGLLTAARVVGAGKGLLSKNDLKLIEELAGALHAEIGCSLPICDDLRWLPTHRVVGSTHNQIAPELYIAVGISGQPQHLSGLRDAKIVVAINNDPEARIFKNCDYGILGDLYKIVPALTTAFNTIV